RLDSPSNELVPNTRCSVGDRRSASISKTRPPLVAIEAARAAAMVDLPSNGKADVNRRTRQVGGSCGTSLRRDARNDAIESLKASRGRSDTIRTAARFSLPENPGINATAGH